VTLDWDYFDVTQTNVKSVLVFNKDRELCQFFVFIMVFKITQNNAWTVAHQKQQICAMIHQNAWTIAHQKQQKCAIFDQNSPKQAKMRKNGRFLTKMHGL